MPEEYNDDEAVYEEELGEEEAVDA